MIRRIVIAICVTLLFVTAGFSSTLFAPVVNFVAGNNPSSVVIGDFNGDGKPDLAIANNTSNNVSVLLGNGDGTFQTAVNYSVGLGPYAVTIGDFNGDGKVDLVVANQIGNSLSFLFGNGNGTFQAAATVPAGSAPSSIAVADFNGDNKADLAVANFSDNNVSIFLGNGDGSFQSPVNFDAGFGASSVIVGDFNNDGKLDLAAANYTSNNVSVLLGNGDGSFQSAANFGVGSGAFSITSGDFNGDSKLDLAVANNTSNNVSVLLGNGNGTFQAAVNYAVGSGPFSIVIGDFNEDGHPDLASSNFGDNSVSVLLGNGNGVFQPALSFSVASGPFSLATGDFNSDGLADLASASNSANVVSILLGSANRTLTIGKTGTGSGTIASTPAGIDCGSTCSAPFALNQVVDLNPTPASGSIFVSMGGDADCADGSLTMSADRHCIARFDVFSGVIATTSNLTSVTPSGAVQFGQNVTLTAQVLPLGATGNVVFMDGVQVLGVATLNFSGFAQLTTKSLGAGNRALRVVYGGDPGGSYQKSQSASSSYHVAALTGDGLEDRVLYASESSPSSIAVADYNGDGILDVAVSNGGSGSVSVMLGNGDGTLQAKVNYAVGDSPFSIAAGDFNGDGVPDLATANEGSNNMSVLIGNGDGTFQPAVNYAAGIGTSHIVVADFNRDAKLDLVVTNFFDNNVSVFLGNGNGTFQNKVNYAVGVGPFSNTVADVNGDGFADVIAANYLANTVSVLLGNGDGTFQSQVTTDGGDHPLSVTSADFNRDGIADIALANEEGTVSVMLGNGDGTFQMETEYDADDEPNGVSTGDFNGDGIVDLVSANHEGDNVSIFIGNGDGTFKDAVNFDDENGPTVVVVADFNGDGVADLVTSNFHADSISILFGIPGTPGTLAISTTTLPVGSVGMAYSQTLAGSGGNPPLAWSVSAGSLPAGLNLDTSTGAITGTPTASGTANFTIHVQDFLNQNANRSLSILVNPPAALVITTTSLPDGPVGSVYSQTVAVTGGVQPYTWSITGGALPAGLSLNTGTGAITGTPTTIGTSNFTVHLTDPVSQTVDQALSIVVTPPPPLSITTSSLPAGIIGAGYSQTAVASGGTLPFNWSVTVGSLPAGLSLNASTGAITGTPTTTATSNFTLHVADGGVQTAIKALSIAVTPPATLTITTTSLPGGSVSGAYSQTVSATGGIVPYTWSISTSALPNGLSLNSITGAITGKPTATGTANFTLHVADTGGQNANQSLAIVVAPAIFQSTTTSFTDITPVSGSTFGQAVTISAKVDPLGSTGTVAFMDEVTILGIGRLDLSSIAELTTISLPPGFHTLRAVYAGDTDALFLPSQSATSSYFVTAEPGAGFEPFVNYDTGGTPTTVAEGDFNGDGRMDLVTANYSTNNLSVLIGNGNGTFHTAVNYPVGTNPYSVAVGDFNGDGRPDLAVSNQGSGSVSVLLGNANGTFQAAVDYGASAGASGIAIADFNNDGRADIAVANSAGNSVSVLLGNGNGTFQTAVNYAVGDAPFWLTAGDFNGDGGADLAVANFGSGSVSVLLGNRNGTFQAAVNYGVGTSPISLNTTDLNGDGRTDLIVANFGGNNLSVLLGNANGTFQPAVNFATGIGPFSIGWGDFDGDGQVDLVVTNQGSSDASVLLGNGNGSFQTAVNYSVGNASLPYSVVVGDFNGDGRADFATANAGSGNVSVLLGIPGVTKSLSVGKTGTGSGTVTSSPTGINCGADCSEAFTAGQIVDLTATPDAGSNFAGWTGDADCGDGSVTMSVAHSCTAIFTSAAPTTLTVSKAGTGSGTITSSPAGVNCGATCATAFPPAQVVVLTATPAAGSVFGTWSGIGCAGGTVTMSVARNCTAIFTLPIAAQATISNGAPVTPASSSNSFINLSLAQEQSNGLPSASASGMPAPSVSIHGLSLANSAGTTPPDVNGDAGPNHYVQVVNSAIGIFSKTGTKLAAFTYASLWSGAGTGTSCETNISGHIDPYVNYDPQTGRWFIEGFTGEGVSGPFYFCLAVSKTADPVNGGYWLYAIPASDIAHPWGPDYEKMAVWSDGVYMSANMINCQNPSCGSFIYEGVRAMALNKDDLISGSVLRSKIVDLNTPSYISLLPANRRGTPPPAGRPEFFVGESETHKAWDVFQFHVDWAGSGTTFTGPASVSQTPYSETPVYAPTPAPGNPIETLEDRALNLMQYRNIGGTESLWVSHAVGTGSDSTVVGTQWAQLNVTGGAVATAPVQDQTFTNGGDGVSRFISSLAVDSDGNMALGYNVSSSSVLPGIRYTGRLAGDPLNQLPQGEVVAMDGLGTQVGTCGTGPCTAWTDQSAMVIDPDGCTFWYTNEYLISNSLDWDTRIVAFKFPSCVPRSNSAQSSLLHLRGDLNGDGKSDILWQHTDGSSAVWLMDGLSLNVGSGLLGPGTGWTIKNRGDFNGDGKTDIVWQHTDGSTAIWLMNGVNLSSGALLLGPGTGWSVKQVGDFNGDGNSDIIWQHTDGSTAIWLMNGVNLISGAGLTGPGTGWSVTQVGDFDGDGKSDLVWQNTDGSTAIWLMDGVNLISGAGLIGPGTGWSVTQVGDFNGDGKSDLVWQNTDGSTAIWLMNGLNQSAGAGLFGAGTGWSVKQVGDFNGDGKSDILWQHTDGSATIWLMNGLSLSSGAIILGPGTGFSAIRTGDFNADGNSDIVWQNSDGSLAIWLMNGLNLSSGGLLLGPSTGWSPAQ